ncbi:alkaline phosphatase [Planococcus glaciei]|uniref:DedA family protein n=1 Tax=Planococcus glaciei TaxID=459472 RepID=A0A1G7VU93_9BACL|nr:DedA family protein [Planococcus glaciei]ETP69098.1 alkaline phosphatase [Planococcus glaciei CHR43]KOF12232.1 alkaline phosphatase [Planococcus glaciei]MBX0314316.1 DedA family protein [Planococcus glaciei]QKX49731.1 DedA family protein [Planococcus glaciei]SDG63366.1 membrane protein DedA, SNARE-associated domain [Planococcus glaciei]
MEQWITSIMSDYGYLGIFLLIMLENVFPPIPSEVILTVGGFMTTTTDMTILGVILASTAGSVSGALILYGIGLLLDVERLEKIVEKYGHILRVKKADIHRADAWFDRYGIWTIFFGRLIPLVRSLISIPAGMANTKFWLFLTFTTLGTLLWNTVLVFVGEAVGENRDEIMAQLDVYSNVVYALIVLGGLAAVWYYVKKIRSREMD